MNCTKCGKEIPDGKKEICKECKKEIKKEEKMAKKYNNDNVGKEKNKKASIKEKVFCIGAIIFVVAILLVICIFINSNKAGNTIGNIRNYGYAVEADNWIYYLAPNEDSTQIGIFKEKNNGKDNKQIYMSEIDIVSLNVYKDYIYFIGTAPESYLEADDVDNKIYRMKTDGTGLEVLNDNELNNDCYEIYVINNQIYYIGLNAEICKMDLNGANKTVIADNGTGYLGITDKYIIYNNMASETDVEYVTYIMILYGTDS